MTNGVNFWKQIKSIIQQDAMKLEKEATVHHESTTESSERSSYGHKPQRGFLSLLAQVSWGVWKVFHHEALASIHTESFLLLCTFYKMACSGGRCRCSWMEDKEGERFRDLFPLSRHPLILNFLRGRSQRRCNRLH